MRRMPARRVAVAAVAVSVIVVTLSACTSPRNALGPSESPCFRAIPVAHAAVNDTGRFAGVRYLSAKDLAAALKVASSFKHRPLKIPPALARTKSAVCAVAYRGRFTESGVAMGWEPSGRPGVLAIVIVRVPSVAVIATIVTGKAPLRLTRLLPSLV